MSDQKNSQQFTNIDKLLENFKNDIEKNSGNCSDDFSSIVMPSPIVTNESGSDSGESAKKYVSQENSDTKDVHKDLTSNPALNDLDLGLHTENHNASEIPQSDAVAAVTDIQSESNQKSDINLTPEKKKPHSIFGAFVKTLVIIFTLGCSVWLLSSGDKMNPDTVSESEKDGAFVFKSSSANLLSTSLSEIHSMPKMYLLEQNDDPAPVPDSTKFTKIDDPERKNYNGEPIDYYKDETIEVKCWKEEIDGIIFNFSEIKIAHPSQFKRKLVDNVVSNKHLDYPLNIFNSVNGVVGMTSDYCAFRKHGTIVQFGKIVRDAPSANLDILIYDEEGNFSAMTNKEFNESELYGSDKVVFTFAFGPVLVDDYKVSTSSRLKSYPIGQVDDIYPRAAIGQFGYDKHYLLCTADYKNDSLHGTTATRMAEVMQQKGCRFAYNMDGGQTSALMFNGKLFNKVAYGGQREVSDVMYFATAIPND